VPDKNLAQNVKLESKIMTGYDRLRHATAKFNSSGEKLSICVNDAAELLGITGPQLYNYLKGSINQGSESKVLKGSEPSEVTEDGKKNSKWGVTPLMFVGLIKHYSLYAKKKSPIAIEMADSLLDIGAKAWLNSLIDSQPSQVEENGYVPSETTIAEEMDKIVKYIRWKDEQYLFYEGTKFTADKKVVKEVPLMEVSKEELEHRSDRMNDILRQTFEDFLEFETWTSISANDFDCMEEYYQEARNKAEIKIIGKYDRAFFQQLFSGTPVFNVLLTALHFDKLALENKTKHGLLPLCVDALTLNAHTVPSGISLVNYQDALAPIKKQAIAGAFSTHLWYLAWDKETRTLPEGSMDVFKKFHEKEWSFSESAKAIEDIKKQLVAAI
jgi:hypothetical protein